MRKFQKKPVSLKKAIEYAEKSQDNSMEFEFNGKKVKIMIVNIPRKKKESRHSEPVGKTGWLDKFFGILADEDPEEWIYNIRSARSKIRDTNIDIKEK